MREAGAELERPAELESTAELEGAAELERAAELEDAALEEPGTEEDAPLETDTELSVLVLTGPLATVCSDEVKTLEGEAGGTAAATKDTSRRAYTP